VSNVKEQAKIFAAKAVRDMEEELGSSWEEVTVEQRDSLARAARRWLELKARVESGESEASADLRFVEVTLSEGKLLAAIVAGAALEDVFWRAVKRVLPILLGVISGL
jgi:hypothetical protein